MAALPPPLLMTLPLNFFSASLTPLPFKQTKKIKTLFPFEMKTNKQKCHFVNMSILYFLLIFLHNPSIKRSPVKSKVAKRLLPKCNIYVKLFTPNFDVMLKWKCHVHIKVGGWGCIISLTPSKRTLPGLQKPGKRIHSLTNQLTFWFEQTFIFNYL